MATIKIKGLEPTLKNLRLLQNGLDKELTNVLRGGGQLIRGEAIRSIQTGPKSGRTYEKYNPRRTHKASAPGQAPASDTGNLVSQIMSVADGKDTLVESRAEYSKFLEFGTSKILPRPFLFPASEKSTKKIVQVLIQKLNKVAEGLKK
jgi:HK97 gp10 family phage protein